MTTGLRVDSLTVRHGDVVACDSVSLEVRPGEIVALLGANGAGKSSLLGALSGLVPATGSVHVGSVDLGRLRPQQRARHLAHVPEGRRLFPTHTVRENLLLGAFAASAGERAARLQRVHELLPRTAELAGRQARGLSGGEQQMVALGRGLMAGAPVLAIDELSLGLAPIVAASFVDALDALRDDGLAVLLVEQYVALALEVADRVVVLERGSVVLTGTAAEVGDQARALQAAYLGSAP